MAIELGSGYVSLVSSSRGLGKSILDDLQKSRKGIGQAGDAAGEGYRESFVSKATGKIGGALKAGLVAGTGAAIGAIGLTIAKGFSRLSAIEQAEAKLRGLGNSAKQVESIMSNALAAVRGTAFAMDEAATTAATAVAAGIKPGKELEAYLKLTADAATIAGTSMAEMGSIINQTTTSGKVFTDNLNQLADRGLPIFQWLQKEYGVSAEGLRAMVESGEIDAARFRKAIADNIGGAALQSGATTVGAWKNTMAAVSRLGANVLKGVFPQIRGGLVGITDAFGRLEPVATVVGQKIGAGLQVAADSVRLFIGSFTGKGADVEVPFMNAIIDAGGTARAIFDQLKITFDQLRSSGGLSALTPVITILQAAAPGLASTLPAIGAAFRDLGTAIGGTLAAALPTVLAGIQGLLPPFLAIVQAALGLAPTLISIASTLLQLITPLLQSKEATLGLGAAILAVVAGIKIARVGMAAYAVITGTITGLQTGYAAATYGAAGATYAKTAAEKAGLVVSKAVRIATLAAAVAQRVWNVAIASNPIGIIITLIAALVAGIIWFFTQTEVGRKIVQVAWAAIQAAVAAVVSWFQTNVLPTLSAVWQGIQTGVGAVVAFFRDTVHPIITGVFQRVGSDINFVWTKIIKPVFDGIAFGAGVVATIAKAAFDGIVSAFQFVGKIIRAVYLGFIKPVFDLFAAIIRWLAITIFKAQVAAIQAAWKALSAGLKIIYDRVIKPVIDFFAKRIADFQRGWKIIMVAARLAWQQLAAGLKSIYDRTIRPVIDFFARRIEEFKRGWAVIMTAIRSAFSVVANAIRDAYNRVIKVVIGWFSERIAWLRSGFSAAINGIRDAWGRVRDTIVSVYNSKIKPIISAFGELILGLKSKFDQAVRNIQTAWDKIKQAAKTPIDFVVTTVLNNGLIAGFNWIADKVPGATHMANIPWPPPGWMTGGYTGKINPNTLAGWVHGDEFVTRSWARRRLERRRPGALDYMNETGRWPGYKAGGRVWPGTTRRLSGNYNGHSGIDIPDPRGAPIYAADDGTITYTGYGRGYGNAVFQQFTSGLSAVYGHTLRTLVAAGQAVRAGQKIALVDSTGNSSGDHIHFEVNPGGGFARASNRAFTINWLKGAVGSSFTGDSTEGQGEGFNFPNPLEVFFAPFKLLIDAAASKITSLPGFDSPLGKIISAVPKALIDGVIAKGKSLIGLGADPSAGAPGAFGKGSGHVSGAAGATARKAAAILGPMFGFSDIGTYAGHDPTQARALDFMIKSKAQGDALASYAKANASRLGVMYLIWYRRIWSVARNREGWRPYNRYGNTSDPSKAHTNHVHASFYARGGKTRRGWGVAGENGPELIKFGGNDTVYPAVATAKIMKGIGALLDGTTLPGVVDQGATSRYLTENGDVQIGANPNEIKSLFDRMDRAETLRVNMIGVA